MLGSQTEIFAQARDYLLPMGMTSENVAIQYGVTRQEQDQAAMSSWFVLALFLSETDLITAKLLYLFLGGLS